jgi:hypothetical protein
LQIVDRRKGIARCQRGELVAPAAEKRIGGDDEPASMQSPERRERGVDLAFGAGLQDIEVHPLRAHRFLRARGVPKGAR